MNLNALAHMGGVIEAWEKLGVSVDQGLVAMPLLLGGLPSADQTRLTAPLPSRHLAVQWKDVIRGAEGLEKRLLKGGSGGLRQVQEQIESALPESVVYASLAPREAKAAKKLKEFQAAALQLRQRLPLAVLRGLGLAPRSLEAEAVLRPWYRRLLGGEGLSDAELAEGVRADGLKLRPAAKAPDAKPVAEKRGKKAGAPNGAARAASVRSVPAAAAKRPGNATAAAAAGPKAKKPAAKRK
jgi:hypothetical protein